MTASSRTPATATTETKRTAMKRIIFEYRDEYTHGEWRKQECIVRSVAECKQIYGLDECEYRILEIEELKR